VASATSGGNIEIRLDSITGPLIGTMQVGGTGGWQTYATNTCSVSGASGTHNIYLKFTGGSGYLFNINWFQFIGGPQIGATYQLVNRNSGKLMDVSGSSTSDGGDVIQWTDKGSNNQKWKLEDAENGYYYLTNINSDKVLDVSGGSTSDGGNIIQWTKTGGANQQWSLQDAGGGYYYLVNKNSGKVAVASGASTADGADVVQWTNNSEASQQWQFIRQ
jgi:hypothetical protein